MIPCRVTVHAPEGVMTDQSMPLLAQALNPEVIGAALQSLRPEFDHAELRSIRVTRYKPGRRCVLEYDMQLQTGEPRTLIGKARRNRHGNKDFERLQLLRQAGFDPQHRDGIFVPEPLGVLGQCGIWLQEKVNGTVLTDLLDNVEAPRLMGRVAEAIYKLHTLGQPALTGRTHSINDELNILHQRLGQLAVSQTAWAARLDDLLAGCTALAKTLQPMACSIHRDFYPDQVLAEPMQNRLYLIDFDLFCAGHPAIDVGNFIGHLTEQALRMHGNAKHYADLEQAFCKRYVELSYADAGAGAHTGAGVSTAADVTAHLEHDIRVATLLTLVRHISLSTELAERQHLTGELLTLCELRLMELRAGTGAISRVSSHKGY